MKKVLLSAAALGLLSSVAIAEPLKLNDGTLGEVAGGFYDTSISAVSNTVTSNSLTTSSTTRTATQSATSMSSNDANAVAVGSFNTGATGTSSSMITFGGNM